MPKSEFKLLVASVAPQCIQRLHEGPMHFPVVVDDVIVKITAFMLSLEKDTTRRSISDIVHSVYMPIVSASASRPCYVAVVDKYSHVTKAKQAEQRSRDAQRTKTSAKTAKSATAEDHDRVHRADIDMRLFKGLMDSSSVGSGSSHGQVTPLPTRSDLTMAGCAWRQSFASDRDFKLFVVALITERASVLLPFMMRQAGLPPHHCIILDGERMDGTPFVKVCRSGSQVSTDLDLERSLVNSLGEFDVAHLHHLMNPGLQAMVAEAVDGSFLVVSVDTDILVINAMRSSDPGYPKDVRISMGLPKKVCLSGVPVTPGELYYFDPCAIRAWGEETLGHTADGFGGLVTAFHLAGSDFNHEGIPGLGNLTVMKEFILWAVQNPTKRIDEFYRRRVQQQHTKYAGVANASQRTRDLKRKCDALHRNTVHPLRRIQWVKDDYWSGKNELDPMGHGYDIDRSDDQKRLCFAEDIHG